VLVSGVKPFTGDQITDVAFAVLAGTHRPLVEVAPHVPDSFAEIVERCLAKHREDRWASVVALARALAPFALRPESAPSAELENRATRLESALVRNLEDSSSDDGTPVVLPA